METVSPAAHGMIHGHFFSCRAQGRFGLLAARRVKSLIAGARHRHLPDDNTPHALLFRRSAIGFTFPVSLLPYCVPSSFGSP